jgi:hypothetical protein
MVLVIASPRVRPQAGPRTGSAKQSRAVELDPGEIASSPFGLLAMTIRLE